MNVIVLISRPCTARMHAACKETRATCSCSSCHLGPCTGCHADNLQALYEGLCAFCAREKARAQPPRTTRCDNCGAVDAFRNPNNRKNEFFCIACQLDNSDSLALPIPLSAVVAPQCSEKNIDDSLHVWVHIRGTRFQCRCGTKKFDAKLRGARRQQELKEFD